MFWRDFNLNGNNFGRSWGSVWREMDRLQREMDRLVRTSTRGGAPAFPAMNVWSGQDGALITAEAPGVEPDSLDISIVGETLTLSGDRGDQELQEGVERTGLRRCFVPRVDIMERDGDITLLADMPGVSSDSVDITLEKNILTIRGAVQFERPEGYDRAYAEYAVGDYERTFALSDEVDRDRIEASVKNGVLRLLLPKAEAAKARKIAVKAA
jgi:HSP20 family protein